MSGLKRYFISTYIGLVAVLSVLGVFRLFAPAHDWGSPLGLLLAAAPPLAFFLWLLLRRPARTSAHPLGLTLLSAAGVVLSMLVEQHQPQNPDSNFYGAALAFIGWYIYLRWYSRLPEPELQHLQAGQALPAFTLESPSGQLIDSQTFRGRPHVFLFYRGNWCPLCVAQVAEVAACWREIEQRGAQVILVSPQPQQHTQALAQRFDVPLSFLCDPHNRAAQRLGIAAPGGLPLGLELFGYSADVVLPTIIISDADGNITYAHVSDNYRVRPEPEFLLRQLDRLSPAKTTKVAV